MGYHISKIYYKEIRKRLGIDYRDYLSSVKSVNRQIIAVTLLVLPLLACKQLDADEQLMAGLSEAMVEEQLVARGIKDEKVLNAMRKVERHRFVPPNLKRVAYIDKPLPIEEGQTISQPYIVALMTELLNLKGGEKVLEVGTGSGYQAAILAEIAAEVYTIEILEPLAKNAERLLNDLGYKNINVKLGDGYLGWAEFAPFDAIIVTCATREIPQPLIEQLKEGGRLVIPVGDFYQELKLVEKKGDDIKVERVIPVRFVPMLRK